ncbi:3-hydroxyacyl-CoA dehydrogenase family protein [Lawsonibacter celer]|uniref:3-hydroxyacyl-CoA dehydrogenase family protein n=1 Tax=Lawsonibacter celer TaxID=2986526 RepID=UPI001645BC15|nr:3-hydroxyacyl-CoA dehydrogenase family protein [Lawsonibacter celer]
MKEIKKVCVAGGGQMGKQIALCAAINGFDVWITDTLPQVAEKLQPWAEEYLAGRVAKGKLTQEAAAAADARFHVASSLEEAAEGADLVIEAILEDQQIKEDFFRKVSALVSEDTIIATNSSFMASSLFVHCVTNPARLANFHYFNPALVMKLIEVVQGPHTSQDTIDSLIAFAKANGKTPIWVKKEIEGFIANRIAKAVSVEAFWLAEQGYATPQDIDTAVENGLNYPLGPFKLLDFAGIDIAFNTRKREYEATGKKSVGYDLLEAKVKAGKLGRKTGKGFYEYHK